MKIDLLCFLLLSSSSIALSQPATTTPASLPNHANLADVETAQIIYPRVVAEKTTRRRRQVSDALSYTEASGKLKVIEMGDWLVELNFEGNFLVAPGLKSEWIDSNGATTARMESLKQCDYGLGVVVGLETASTAALTICQTGTITGYVAAAGTAYFISPLNETTKSHLLYTSKKLRKRSTANVWPDGQLASISQRQHQYWHSNLTGDTMDIGSGEEDAIELTEQPSNASAPNEEESDINIASGATNNSNSIDVADDLLFYTQSRIDDWHREQIDDEDAGYFFDTAWTARPIYSQKRQGVASQPQRWLEVAVAADHTLVAFHGRDKIESYILSLMNIVNAIYQDPSLDSNLKLVVTRLQIYEHNTKPAVIRPGNAKRSLENVNNWNRRLHMSLAPGQPQHDIAVWLTRSDIGGPSGYAPVGGVCDPKRSCALNRDEGLTSAFIIAHETAHIMGLSHDGDHKTNNNCGDKGPDGSIMSPMVAATFNKFFWSECSKKEFRNHAKKWSCLLNEPNGDKGEILLNATLETSFTMDEQCRMEFGDGYTLCRSFDIIEPCSHLWCGHRASPLVCKTKKGPPLEGTECGFSKWCVNGYCEDVGQKVFDRIPVVLNPQDGGWSEWGPWGMCSKSCGIGVEFRQRKCNNPMPSYGGKNCDGEAEEWRICNTNACPDPITDLRAEQCKRLPKLLNIIDKAETKLIWLPFESQHDNLKCKFICISQETKETFVTDENLIDGTPCSYDAPDGICVQGKCYKVGCDGRLDSDLKKDKCGVCGGDNSNCTEVNTPVKRKLKREVSRVAVLPRMATEINVEVNVTMEQTQYPDVAFILKNRRKKKFIITIPDLNNTEIIEGTKFLHRKFNNTHRISARGPVLAEMIILLFAPLSEIQTGLFVSAQTEYTIHKNFLIPSKRYVWIKGGWGPCSASCGGGRRQRTVACWDNLNDKLVRRKFCSLIQKPNVDTEKCNTFGCNFEWVAGEWEPCSTTCGTSGVQYRELYCLPKSVLTKLNRHNSTTLKTPWKYMVSPNKCSGMAPQSMRFCNRKPCFSYWSFGEWSECSASCGSGVQIRYANCPPPQNETYFTCGKEPPAQRRICQGSYNRHNNVRCKERKRRQCNGDESKFCSMPLLNKYCKIRGFRRACCKTCSSFHLTPVSV